MKFTIGVTLDIDPEAWAGEYDLAGSTAAVADITEVLTRHAADGAFAEAFTSGWGMMRDLATVTVSAPGHVLAGMTWSETLAAAEVGHLEAAGRGSLMSALRGAERADDDAALVAAVRAHVAAQGYGADRVPVAAVFAAKEWDNGHFLSECGLLFFADGSAEDIDMYDTIDELLNADGACGSDAALGVDLRTGKVTADEYGHTVYQTLGLTAADLAA